MIIDLRYMCFPPGHIQELDQELDNRYLRLSSGEIYIEYTVMWSGQWQCSAGVAANWPIVSSQQLIVDC